MLNIRFPVPVEDRPLVFFLAAEEYLARNSDEDCFLLWQVGPTVIFGRNQVMEAEVNVPFCREHGIRMFRRKSGGGCVYADRGNLMISAVSSGNDKPFIFEKFISALALALRRGEKRGLGWGIKAAEKERYREALARLGLGLEDRMSIKVGLLSGGQRQALTLLMATLKKPRLLLLDEHTAALDPKTAAKVLSITEELVAEGNLTTIMVTHNMKDAIAIGNRLIMMNNGKIIYDVSGEEKKNLTVEDLLKKFSEASGEELVNDRMMLA